MGAAIEKLEEIRAGFSLRAAFGTPVETESVADGFVSVIGPHVTEDFTCLMDGGLMTTSYDGIEGLRQGWLDFLGAFESLAIEPRETHESPDGTSVVEFVHMTGTPRGTDAAIQEDAAAVWTLRGNRLSAVDFYMDRQKALRAAGLVP